MRILRLIGIAFVAVLLGMNLTACSDDDDENGTDKTTGTSKNHEWVDLGLSVNWATCNIGASSPGDYGDYYAWGETKTKSEYSRENSVTDEVELDDISGKSKYDAARANWGGSWRMPTYDEIMELREKCVWEWTTMDGHNGYKGTGSNGNSIFLPAAGFFGSRLDNAEYDGYYWSSTPYYKDNSYYAYELNFYEDFPIPTIHALSRARGLPIRPVIDK